LQPSQANPYIVLLGNYLPDNQTSMLRFVENLHHGLPERGISVELIRPEAIVSRFAPRTAKIAKWLGYVDKFVLFPSRLRSHLARLSEAHGERLIVHVCDHSNAVYMRHLTNFRHVVTCHDLIAVQLAAGLLPGPSVSWTGRRLQAMIHSGLKQARRIACDSNNTRHDLLGMCQCAPETAITIPCQLNYPFSPLNPVEARKAVGAKFPQDGRPVVLHVGNNSWYKNRDGVLRIFAQVKRAMPEARPRLVVIGRKMNEIQQRFIANQGLASDVTCLPDATPHELHAAYSLAAVFLFPSIYEGFGWPPLEAQACGCPVVAGTGGSLKEVLADSAMIADGREENQLADFTIKLLGDQVLRERLRTAGFHNVERFKPPQMIDRYLEYYHRILEEDFA
jgi:glycosyltransferase involved in cell wall biosynthesis